MGTILSREEINKLFLLLNEVWSEAKIELNYINSYTLAIAVILSARATDKGVNKATPALFAVASTPQEMLELGEERLLEMIKTIGLYRAKARNIIAMSRMLIERFDGELPGSFDDIITLPGIGIKSANVLLNAVFDKGTIGVDTHVFRVANRTGLCIASSPNAMSRELPGIVPDDWKRGGHYMLVLHGRYICIARKPKCNECDLREICRYFLGIAGAGCQ